MRQFPNICAFLLFAGLASSTLAAPAWIPKLSEAPLPSINSEPRVVYPNHVVGLRNIPFKTILGYRDVTLDLYVPTNLTVKKPVVIWLHGGGFELGNGHRDWTWADWTKVLDELAGRGYVVAAIDYRLDLEAKYPAPIEDMKDAIRFLRKNADLYGIDSDRFVAWGLSAGGYLSQMAGTSCHVDALNGGTGEKRISTCVQGVVDWFAPTDMMLELSKANPGVVKDMVRMDKLFYNCPDSGCSQAVLRAASPVTYVSNDTPPFLIMQGGADPLVDASQSQRLYDVLTAHGVKATLHILPGLGHGFTGATEAQKKAILNTTFDFMDRTMGKR